jgi:hypothetical protein
LLVWPFTEGFQEMTPEPLIPQTPGGDNQKAAFAIAVVSLCFGSLGAAWSFIGGLCCGWAGWGWAFIGLVLSIVSLILRKSKIGWWALGVSIFAFAWVYIQAFIIAAGSAGSVNALSTMPHQ